MTATTHITSTASGSLALAGLWASRPGLDASAERVAAWYVSKGRVHELLAEQARMGKVKVGDIVQAKADQPFGPVKSIERDGTDVVVTFRAAGTYYLPADQRVTVDRP